MLLLTSSRDDQLGCGSHRKAPVCSDGRVPCQQEVRGALVWRKGGRWLRGGDLGTSLSLGTFLGTSDYSLGKQGYESHPHGCRFHSWTLQGTSGSIFPGHFTSLFGHLARDTALGGEVRGAEPPAPGSFGSWLFETRSHSAPSSSRKGFLPGKCIPERPLAVLLTQQPSSVCSPSGPRGLCEHHKVESTAQPPSERGELWSSAPDQSAISLPSVVTSLKHPEESRVAGSPTLLAQQPRPHW